MKNKKILIIAGLVIVLLALSLLVINMLQRNQASRLTENNSSAAFQPEFMTTAEKTEKGISTDLRVQAMTRDASGTVMVYKIIRSDSDIKNPAEIKAISPRQE